jgi:hypothetical protein
MFKTLLEIAGEKVFARGTTCHPCKHVEVVAIEKSGVRDVGVLGDNMGIVEPSRAVARDRLWASSLARVVPGYRDR